MIKVGTQGITNIKNALVALYNGDSEVIVRVLTRYKSLLAEDICDHIHRGVDSEEAPLKSNTGKTAKRKRRQGYGAYPLIETGAISTVSNWTASVKRNKRNEIALGAMPTSSRFINSRKIISDEKFSGYSEKHQGFLQGLGYMSVAQYAERYKTGNLNKMTRGYLRKKLGARNMGGTFMVRDATIFFQFLPSIGYDKSQQASDALLEFLDKEIHKEMEKFIGDVFRSKGVS